MRDLVSEGFAPDGAGAFAGDGGPATEASLNEPHGLRLYGNDILLISDHFNNRIRAIKL